MIRRLVLTVAAILIAVPVLAVEPDEMLSDPALEARAREVSKELRCVVCQNNSIDDSNAELAGDMRVLVRERILAGDTNEEVLQFMVDRYGNFVLLKPPVEPETYALWYGPVIFALIALAGGFVIFRARAKAAAASETASTDTGAGTKPAPLSAEEQAKLDALLNNAGDDKA